MILTDMSAASPEVPLRVAVVDDEEPARRLLREYLAALPGVELVAECSDGFEAVKAVARERPDVLLLDVRMPRLDGFEVVELLDAGAEPRPLVIFTTAYDDYALAAFEVHAVDYLLKPFAPERLAEALEQARARRGEGAPSRAPVAEVAKEARGGRPAERVLVRDGGRIHVLAAADIDWVEAKGDAVEIVRGGERHRKPQTLGELEALLDPGRFVRIHRSFLLNVERLERLELYAKDSRVAILSGGTRLPVSRSGYARLRELL